jgi:hypothetical protein
MSQLSALAQEGGIPDASAEEIVAAAREILSDGWGQEQPEWIEWANAVIDTVIDATFGADGSVR